MHLCSLLLLSLGLAGTTTARPTASTTRNTRREACMPGRIVAPPLLTFKGSRGDKEVCLPKGNNLSVRLADDDSSTQHQVALFQGIPETAKTCSFGWKQREENDEKSFHVSDMNGLIEFRVLTPGEEHLSYNKVDQIIRDEELTGQIDLTSWDGEEYAVSSFHLGGIIDCAEKINVLLSVSDLNGDTGGALLKGVAEARNEEELQGLFVEWTC